MNVTSGKTVTEPSTAVLAYYGISFISDFINVTEVYDLLSYCIGWIHHLSSSSESKYWSAAAQPVRCVI